MNETHHHPHAPSHPGDTNGVGGIEIIKMLKYQEYIIGQIPWRKIAIVITIWLFWMGLLGLLFGIWIFTLWERMNPIF